jgi:Tfp pilus assembly protein PilX
MKHFSHQCPSFRPPRRQSGAVLIVAMVILVILTLLGVTAMNTSSLEEKMASNTQEQVRTFQAAETGISQAGQDINAFKLAGTCGVSDVVSIDFAGSDNSHTYCSTFMGWSATPPGTLWGAGFRAAHFNFRSTGTSGSNLSKTLNGGAYQIAPNPK